MHSTASTINPLKLCQVWIRPSTSTCPARRTHGMAQPQDSRQAKALADEFLSIHTRHLRNTSTTHRGSYSLSTGREVLSVLPHTNSNCSPIAQLRRTGFEGCQGSDRMNLWVPQSLTVAFFMLHLNRRVDRTWVPHSHILLGKDASRCMPPFLPRMTFHTSLLVP